MKNWFTSLLLGCWLVASPIAAHSQRPNTPAASPEEQALMANSRAVAEALTKRDADFLKRTLTDDFREVWSDGHLHPKGELLEAAQEGAVQEFTIYNLRVLPVDDSAAIVTYEGMIKMPEGDPPGMAPRYQHISDLWVKQDGQWRLRFQQFTPVRPID